MADGADYSKGWNMEEAGYLQDEEERTTKQKIKVSFAYCFLVLVWGKKCKSAVLSFL
jgi:hypothetical protein